MVRAPARGSGFEMAPTPHGHDFGEAASALQKSIRRSLDDEAVYWAAQLDLGGYPHYVWRRLYVIASEDIGMAEPEAIVQVRALHSAWRELKENDKKGSQQANMRLFMAQAVMVLARARKSRLINDATQHWNDGEDHHFRREVPDYALDMHTKRGRQLGRGLKHFFDESSRLVDPGTGEDVTRRDDEYERRVLERYHPDHEAPDENGEPRVLPNGD